MVDTNIVYATDTYVNFLKFLHVLRGMISDDRARTKYKYMEYASMKICYFRVRHVRTYTICQALDDGILRLKGRFGNSPLAFEHKHPILLRNTSYFTKLVILNAHERVGHLRLLGTLNELRSKFWICKGRQTVKSTIGKCVTRIKVIGKTLIGPTSPSLPDYRVTSHFAFQKIGLDYAGPLHVKDIYTNDASDMHKAYACLFTCASTRNVV